MSKFASDVVFNPKTTEWQLSYDGRNKEPIFLPVKFPLLLAQGGEGIAVGLSCKVLPHNFIELIDASIACLRNKSFELVPDFATGGMADVENCTTKGNVAVGSAQGRGSAKRTTRPWSSTRSPSAPPRPA